MSNRSEKFTDKVEKYDLPTTVDGICHLVKEILHGGSVKRMMLSVDDPLVRVTRSVQDVGLEEPDVTLDAALRNVPDILEYSSPEASPFQVLVDMTQLVSREGMNCAFWVTGMGGSDILDRWLEFDRRGMPGGVRELLTLQVKELKSIPADVLILCGSRYPNPDPEDVMLAVRTAIELRNDYDESDVAGREVDGAIGDGSGERSAPVDPLAFGTWEPDK